MHLTFFLRLALVAFCFLATNPRFSCAASATTGASAPATLTTEEKTAGWRPLFDGQSLAGWRLYGKPAATTIGPG